MNVRRLKVCMLTAAAVGLTAADASAFGGRFGKKSSDCCAPAAPVSPCGAPAGGCGTGYPAAGVVAAPVVAAPAPTYTTVKETILVPTQVQETRTVTRSEWKPETYTAYKTEYVQEAQPYTYTVKVPHTETVMESRTVTKKVQETVMETKTVTKKVPVTKTVTVMEHHWETQQVTETKSKHVRNVSYTPTEVHVGPGILDKLKAHCDPCAAPSCGTTKTVCKKHVSYDTVCEPVTVCKKVKVCVPVTKQVCSYECVSECVTVPVCKWKCVTETIQVPVCKTTYTCETKTGTKNVCVAKQVAYQATRNVCVQVPHTETVTVCKLVPKVVEKQVAVAAPCGGCGAPAAAGCGTGGCGAPACDSGCGSSKASIFDKLKARLGSMKHHKCHADCGCAAPAPTCGGC